MNNIQNFSKEERPWGYFQVITKGEGFLTKILHVNSNQKLSLQSHKYRSEHWVVISGKAKVTLDDEEYMLSVGESIDIPVQSIHSLENIFPQDLEVLEVQFGQKLSEDDIIRYKDIYGRI